MGTGCREIHGKQEAQGSERAADGHREGSARGYQGYGGAIKVHRGEQGGVVQWVQGQLGHRDNEGTGMHSSAEVCMGMQRV